MSDLGSKEDGKLLPQEIIRQKRDGSELSENDISRFIRGVTTDAVTDAQIAAFAMAIFFKGMTNDEAAALTLSMRDSGNVLKWDDLPGPVVDKHSTGGVGDNVSLILAPILAASGVFVPMISGRGLGHTGGTLDKLESIPGYSVHPDNTAFRACVRKTGAAIIGQTADLAPADKRIYAVRDVTATVESIPLITASILSKKLAAGLHALVLDVKSGNGAFMDKARKASILAKSLVTTAKAAGLPASALITDMDQPLASAAGNAVEVQNAIEFLTNTRRDRRLELVTLALAAECLHLAGATRSNHEATSMVLAALDTGRAAEAFGRMVSELGGPADLVENPKEHLPKAEFEIPVPVPKTGFVSAIATRRIGLAVLALGGGRTRPQDKIDHAVGITKLQPVGAELSAGEPLAIIHARNRTEGDAAARIISEAFSISDKKMPGKRPVIRRLT